jgi:hypothetical protein
MTDPSVTPTTTHDRSSPGPTSRTRGIVFGATVLAVVAVMAAVAWHLADDHPSQEATTIVSTTPNETLFPVKRYLPGGGENLRVILVESFPGATTEELNVGLIVDFPEHPGESVIVGAQPLERYGYTFTLVGVREPDTAILRIIDPQGHPLSN